MDKDRELYTSALRNQSSGQTAGTCLLIYCYVFIETGSHHVAQAGLELLGSDCWHAQLQLLQFTAILFFVFFFFLRQSLTPSPGWSAVARSWLTTTFASGFKRFSCLSLPIEMGFLHVGQAGLELLTSGDPPTSASQSSRITGVSHRSRPIFYFFN
ncbi:hypothetical protein AAY473_012872 [Plecturocebus cupreus]